MATLTLDRVLTEAEALPADEQEMLESLLRQRRIEAWRQETAAEAKAAIKSFRTGKLKSQSAGNIIARLRKASPCCRACCAARAPSWSTSPSCARLPDPTEAVLLVTFAVNGGDLETLAASRAKTVQAYLLQSGKVTAARLFLKQGELRRDGSKVNLSFR
jgi:hypothetical protein